MIIDFVLACLMVLSFARQVVKSIAKKEKEDKRIVIMNLIILKKKIPWYGCHIQSCHSPKPPAERKRERV